MGYRSLRECVNDLERHGQLVRVEVEVDPHLEMAEIHRRVYQAGGPALYFARPKGCKFPMVSNLFGTLERTRFLFRDRLELVRKLVELKIEPAALARKPWRYWDVPLAGLSLLPQRVRRGPVLEASCRLSELPQLKCWPRDGGAFVTLPQVYSEDADRPGWRYSNLGMYRVQLSGNDYDPEGEVGLHYQIHRGIGVHHAHAIRKGVPFHVNVFVGGPPAMTLAAVMPLPEGLPELVFAGALGGRRIRLAEVGTGTPVWADADFAIVGTVDPDRQKPEGPFGDHLGYYSLIHDFPVLKVHRVLHRKDAIWPFTVVGRPPQEDTSFGEIIHELTGPVLPTVLPGVRGVHAVDAAGVHPLLLAIGSERYVPYNPRRVPMELLTQANAILGQGQLSLAKYLLIVAHEDDPDLDIHDIAAFFRHLLERIDPTRDLHFQTRTTIDTLDYTGTGFNSGSKLVLAAVGPKRRELPTELPPDFRLPEGFREPRVCIPGVLAVTAPGYIEDVKHPRHDAGQQLARFCESFTERDSINRFPLVLLVDDSEFVARTLNNFLWVTFTRSNPAADLSGIGAFIEDKHFGCTGSIVIDARIKAHHAPPLVEDSAVTRRVDELAAPGGPLHGLY